MLKIADLEISCFRSILNLKLCIESEPNLISICGENNVGKTNTLRAINLFFNPEDYEISMDRPTLKQAQGGARIDPKITVTLFVMMKMMNIFKLPVISNIIIFKMKSFYREFRLPKEVL